MVVLHGWRFELGFMPSNHYSGSDTSRPEMGMMGIMNRVRGMRIVENGFHVRMMFLLLGLLLSIVNLPVASGVIDSTPPPPPTPDNSAQIPIAPSSPPQVSPSPSGGSIPFPPGFGPPPRGPPPPIFSSPLIESPPPPLVPPPPPLVPPPPPSVPPPPPLVPPPSTSTTQSTTSGKTGGDTWNEPEIAGVVIASIAALLQVAVVAFLLIKRHQMLTTVEYDDIEDLEYDTPPDSNFRDIESA